MEDHHRGENIHTSWNGSAIFDVAFFKNNHFQVGIQFKSSDRSKASYASSTDDQKVGLYGPIFHFRCFFSFPEVIDTSPPKIFQEYLFGKNDFSIHFWAFDYNPSLLFVSIFEIKGSGGIVISIYFHSSSDKGCLTHIFEKILEDMLFKL
jgi:hypothetical protein